jgi:uncharacterized protein YfdQ (DUF2303 family)
MISQELIDAIRVESQHGGLILPPNYKHVPEALTVPLGIAAHVEVGTLQSLADYVENFHDSIVVFANDRQIKAVLDYHAEMEEVGRANHTATFHLSTTAEWKAWKAISGRPMSQREFAEFIEEHLDEIHSPPPADVLTIANTLSGKRNVSFSQVNDLANGDKSLVWEEKTDAKSAGDIRVPSKIVLRIPIYEGAEESTTYEVTALFRYRIADGKLTYEVKLLKTERILKQAFERVVEQLAVLLPETSTLIVGNLAADRDSINREKTIHKN